MDEAIEAPRAGAVEYAPRISTIQIDPDKIGLLIGKGGETIRGLSEETRPRSTSTTTARCSSTPSDRRQGDALVDQHPLDDQGGRGRRRVPAARSSRRRRSAPSSSSPRAPTACCTSPTSRPGHRVEHGRGGAQQGRRDRRPRRRGRQGARPHRPAPHRGPGHRGQDQGGAGRPSAPATRRGAAAVAAATADRGATAGGPSGGGREPRARPRPRPWRRSRPRPPTATADRRYPIIRARVPDPASHHRRLDSGCGSSRRHALRAVRGPGLLRGHRLAWRGWGRGRPLALPRAHAVPRHRALRVRARSTSCSTAWAPSSTPARTRRAPRSTRGCSTRAARPST